MPELIQNLARRSQLLRSVRDFFYARNFLEVETPVRIAAPAPEEYIEAIPSADHFLRTSPELEMKCLLAEGMEKIFQIGSCFRSGEFGRKHREEFTMLEYYAMDWDYRKLANFTFALLQSVARQLKGGLSFTYQGEIIDLTSAQFITVEEAFRRWAGVSALSVANDDSFDELMVTKVEPQLGKNGVTFLMDYPACRASLARLSPADPRVAERWEMYIAGIELANAFGELTDAVEQKARFAASAKFRAEQNMAKSPSPVEFFRALERGIPNSSGCALGIDRLAMIFLDADDIAQVRL